MAPVQLREETTAIVGLLDFEMTRIRPRYSACSMADATPSCYFDLCATVGDRRMHNHNSDYYREEAARYKKLAEAATDPAKKKEFLELAEACAGIADSIDDRRSSG
jgi:hypothetical protein